MIEFGKMYSSSEFGNTIGILSLFVGIWGVGIINEVWRMPYLCGF